MSQVEPDSSQPDDVEHYINGAREGQHDVSETISRIAKGISYMEEFSEHHVVPEVEQVQQQTKTDNQSQHEHVLRCPLHLASIYRSSYIVATVATSGTVLCSQDECIDDVNHSQGCQTKCSYNSIPVGTQQFANHVVSLSREQRCDIHATVECQEQNQRNTRYGHYNLSTD